jgi:hypothetical protein
MGGALDAPKVFLRRRVKPLRLGKTGAFVLDAIQDANAVLGLMQAGDLSGWLVVSVKSLISPGRSGGGVLPRSVSTERRYLACLAVETAASASVELVATTVWVLDL